MDEGRREIPRNPIDFMAKTVVSGKFSRFLDPVNPENSSEIEGILWGASS